MLTRRSLLAAATAIQLGRDQLAPDIDGMFRPAEAVLTEAALMAGE